MVGLTSLKVYNSIFNITEEDNNFELYANIFDEFFIAKLKDSVAEILGLSDISSSIYNMKYIEENY